MMDKQFFANIRSVYPGSNGEHGKEMAVSLLLNVYLQYVKFPHTVHLKIHKILWQLHGTVAL